MKVNNENVVNLTSRFPESSSNPMPVASDESVKPSGPTLTDTNINIILNDNFYFYFPEIRCLGAISPT